MSAATHEHSVPTRALEHSRWAVLWIEGKRVRIERPGSEAPGENFADALALYEEMKCHGGIKGLTLRCCNVGFPPPEEYMPRIVRVKVKNSRGKPIKRNGRYQYKEVLRSPMKKLNKQGTWWCPYCIKLRRFKERHRRHTKVITHECPMCGVSHRDHKVRAHNPIAQRLPI